MQVNNYGATAGVDEVGRGPIAGDVYAAAVILDPEYPIEGLADSKLLTPYQRMRKAKEIRENARAWCIASASVVEIDTLNILNATLLAMQRAVSGLKKKPKLVLIDGNKAPDLLYPVRTVIRGDSKINSISAASILAKTARDEHLIRLHSWYPNYDFARNKGYGTQTHLRLLSQHGPCSEHRRTFRPIRKYYGEQ